MTSTVATEIPETSPVAKPALETWGKNERMRHVPAAEWIADKVDIDLRRRVDILCASFSALPAGEPHRAKAEAELNSVCRALERLADIAKHSRAGGSHPSDVPSKMREALNHAVANLRGVDASLFGRRHPFHTFERSKSEPLYAGLLVVIYVTNRATAALREADRGLDERLLDGIVTLQEPLRTQPIA